MAAPTMPKKTPRPQPLEASSKTLEGAVYFPGKLLTLTFAASTTEAKECKRRSLMTNCGH